MISFIKTWSVPVIVLLAGMVVLRCENDLGEINKVTQFKNLPDQTVINSTINYSDSGIMKFRISAGRIDRYFGESPHDEFSDQVVVISYDGLGKFESRIDAKNATNLPKEKLMIARDSVTWVNFEGKRLKTEELTWNEKEKRIYTDKFVRITTTSEVLFGDGLEATEDFSEYAIKNIKGRIKIDESDSINTP